LIVRDPIGIPIDLFGFYWFVRVPIRISIDEGLVGLTYGMD